MDSYEIQWKRTAEHDLRNTNRSQVPRIIRIIESLQDNPFPPQCRKLKKAKYLYRIRIGDYRVVYHVESTARKVTIYYVRHRREAYKR